MVSTKRFMNWTGVGFTPNGGTAILFTGVKSVSFDRGISLLKFAADGDRLNTLCFNEFAEPKASVSLADLAAVQTLNNGAMGVFTATHNDAINKAVTGSFAITYSFTNAVVGTIQASGEHRAIGMGSLAFEHQSSDGQTYPITMTVL